MKVLHTSDWHLGKNIHARSLLPEQTLFFNDVFIPIIEKERPDLIVISGDIFDRSVAPVDAILLYDHILFEIAVQRNIQLAIISGNHDGAERLAMGGALLKNSGLYIASNIQDALTPVEFEDEQGKVQLWMLPYLDPAQIRDFTGNAQLRGFSDSYAALLDLIREKMNPCAFQLLMAHCFVTGGQSCDSEVMLYVGGSGEIDNAHFAGFDYVALGHLHSPQKIADGIYYSGSPLKYSFDEQFQKKAVMVFETTQAMNLQKIPLRPVRDMRVIQGTMETLLAQAGEDEKADDFIYAKLTDELPLYNPMAQLREKYPNILGLDNRGMHQFGESEIRSELRDQLKRKRVSDIAIFEAFIRHVSGQDATDDDRLFFTEVYQKSCREDNAL